MPMSADNSGGQFFLLLYFLFDHVEGAAARRIGNISSLPRSIAADSTAVENGE